MQITSKMYAKGPKPKIAYEGDAGIDLCYNGKEQFQINRGIVYKIPTGVFMEIPVGYAGIIYERSGLASKNGLEILGRVVDSGYRGEIIVICGIGYYTNVHDVAGGESFPREIQELVVKSGDKIAQMVIVPCHPMFSFVEKLEDLSSTQRAEKGLGSSGKQ